MVLKQSLLDFKVPPDIFSAVEDIENKISVILQEHLGASGPIFSSCLDGLGKLLVYGATDGSHCTVRILPEGLITLDIVYRVDTDKCVLDTDFPALRISVEKAFSANIQVIPPIIRGSDINNYRETSDGRIMEYDFDKVVYHEQSSYQDILIMHSRQFGNMLLLDNVEMLAESDMVYTQAITGNGREDFEGKTVLILGGGDGGIIHELLKKKTKFVTMVEIDRLVIEAANSYLQGICGSTMLSLDGPNHKILVGDCIDFLRKCVQEGRTFDYVINDLTDVPIITVEVADSHWEFIRQAHNLSLQVLAPKGKYFAQGTYGPSDQKTLKLYEHQLSEAYCPIEFRKELIFVPSFLELWTIYEIWKAEPGKGAT